MKLENIDNSLKKGVDKVFGFFGKTTSILIASLFLVFSLGSLYGFFIAQHNSDAVFLLLIPPALGIFAYYSRGFAVFIAIVLLILLIV